MINKFWLPVNQSHSDLKKHNTNKSKFISAVNFSSRGRYEIRPRQKIYSLISFNAFQRIKAEPSRKNQNGGCEGFAAARVVVSRLQVSVLEWVAPLYNFCTDFGRAMEGSCGRSGSNPRGTSLSLVRAICQPVTLANESICGWTWEGNSLELGQD